MPAAAERRTRAARAAGVPDTRDPRREPPASLDKGVAIAADLGRDPRRGGRPDEERLGAAPSARRRIYRDHSQARLPLHRRGGRSECRDREPRSLPALYQGPLSVESADRDRSEEGHRVFRARDRTRSSLRSRLLGTGRCVYHARLSQPPRAARGLSEGERGGNASRWTGRHTDRASYVTRVRALLLRLGLDRRRGRVQARPHAQPQLPDRPPLVRRVPDGDGAVRGGAIGHVEGVSGRAYEALETLDGLHRLAKERYVTPYGVALVHAGRGDNDQALAWLVRALADRSHWLVWLKLDPRLDALRSDRRYTELLQAVGLR